MQNTRSPRILVILVLLALLLAACKPSLENAPVSGPAIQPKPGSHPPVILKVVEREEVVNGLWLINYDIYFMDPDGDAEAITYQVTSTSLPYTPKISDTLIQTSAEEQKGEALFTETTGCWQKMELVYEGRIRDQAGNLSEPVRFSLSCTAPEALNTRSFLVSGITSALSVALILLVGFWLLFRKRPADRLPALRSTILFVFLFMFVRFLQLVVHEGGHAIHALANGVPITLYVHPFFFRGFSRPIILDSSIWKDVLGSGAALPVGLLIFLLFWKRRSPVLLPLVMLAPYIAMTDGFNVMGIQDDFHNLINSTGLPAAPFFIAGLFIFCIGVLSMLSLFPLGGLDPQNHQALFVLPAAMFLGSALSFLVEHLVVPTSPIHLEYFMAWEILADNHFIFWVGFGIIFAVLYDTLFRKLYPHLPAWLRAETVTLTWKDLRIPGILWALSVITGLIIIT